MSEWIKKKRPPTYAVYKKLILCIKTDRLKVKGCGKISDSNTSQKKGESGYINLKQSWLLNKENYQGCREAPHTSKVKILL